MIFRLCRWHNEMVKTKNSCQIVLSLYTRPIWKKKKHSSDDSLNCTPFSPIQFLLRRYFQGHLSTTLMSWKDYSSWVHSLAVFTLKKDYQSQGVKIKWKKNDKQTNKLFDVQNYNRPVSLWRRIIRLVIRLRRINGPQLKTCNHIIWKHLVERLICVFVVNPVLNVSLLRITEKIVVIELFLFFVWNDATG